MEIDKAKYLLKDYANQKMNCTFIEATDTVIKYLEELERKLNNKEKVYTIDKEEILLQITNMKKRIDNEEKKKEIEEKATLNPTKRSRIHHDTDKLRARQNQCQEIIELIRNM